MPTSAISTPTQGIELTDSAARRIAWLQSQEEHKGLMLRVSVSGGGWVRASSRDHGVWVLTGQPKLAAAAKVRAPGGFRDRNGP